MDKVNFDEDMLKAIKMIIIDVDGTMTDGGIYYDENGNEMKKFCTKDAAGFFAARKVGIEIVVLTGRKCRAVEKRMAELKVDSLKQNIKNKVAYLNQIVKNKAIRYEEIAYIGDDLNDLPSMKIVGFVGCPNDACREVIQIAQYVSSVDVGGRRVIDKIEYILKKRGEWNKVISEVYGVGI